MLAETALAFAHIYAAGLLSPYEIAVREVASAKYFAEFDPHGAVCRRSFPELVQHFKVMLGGTNLLKRSRWYERARLWRLILLQSREGWWDPSPGVAFGLLAQYVRPTDTDGVAAPHGVRGLRQELSFPCSHAKADAEALSVRYCGCWLLLLKTVLR